MIDPGFETSQHEAGWAAGGYVSLTLTQAGPVLQKFSVFCV